MSLLDSISLDNIDFDSVGKGSRVNPGAYKASVTGATEPEESKSGKGLNFKIYFNVEKMNLKYNIYVPFEDDPTVKSMALDKIVKILSNRLKKSKEDCLKAIKEKKINLEFCRQKISEGGFDMFVWIDEQDNSNYMEIKELYAFEEEVKPWKASKKSVAKKQSVVEDVPF